LRPPDPGAPIVAACSMVSKQPAARSNRNGSSCIQFESAPGGAGCALAPPERAIVASDDSPGIAPCHAMPADSHRTVRRRCG